MTTYCTITLNGAIWATGFTLAEAQSLLLTLGNPPTVQAVLDVTR